MSAQAPDRVLAAFVGGAASLLIGWPAAVGAFNPQPEPPGHATGDYQGYSQSETHPDYHPYMALSVVSQDDKGRLAGVLTMGTPGGRIPVDFQGKIVDEAGHFKGVAYDGLVGKVQFEGVLQSVGVEAENPALAADDVSSPDDGVLVVAHYKFTDLAGNVDQGMTWLLRSFDACAPCLRPDLIADWRGTAASRLTGDNVVLTLSVTGQDGASFTGIAEVLGIDPTPFAWAVVGTIGARGNIVMIAVGDPGFVEVGAMYDPPDPIKGSTASIRGLYFDHFATGASDLGDFAVSPAE